MSLENKFEGKVPYRERIVSPVDVLSNQSLSEDAVGTPRACRPSTTRVIFRCTLPPPHIDAVCYHSVILVSLNVPMEICRNVPAATRTSQASSEGCLASVNCLS